MKRHPTLVALSHEHHYGLVQARRLRGGAQAEVRSEAATAFLQFFGRETVEHFREEEERLFPLYEETSGEEGATEPFCAEHDDMRASFWVLATITPADEPERYRAELDAIQAAFDAHAAEEERRMYPLFERMLER